MPKPGKHGTIIEVALVHRQVDLKEEYSELKSRLSNLFSSKVDLSCDAKGKGKITISFKNDDEFLKILEFFDSIQNH